MKTFKRNNAIVQLTEIIGETESGEEISITCYTKLINKDDKTYIVDEYSYTESTMNQIVEILLQRGYTEMKGDQNND